MFANWSEVIDGCRCVVCIVKSDGFIFTMKRLCRLKMGIGIVVWY